MSTFDDRFPTSDWTMGEAAAPDTYPDAFEAAAARVARPYQAVQQRAGTSNLPAVAEELWPKEPWQYALMAAAPGSSLIGRGIAALPTAARAGIAAGGMLLSGVPGYDTNQAEGGVLDKAAKAAKALRAAATDVAPGIGGPSYLSPADQKLFATRYPKAGEFTEMAKDRGGTGTYRSKEYTAEETRLLAARNKVMEDMKQGYTPYFDPAQRYDVDYQQYLRLFGQPENTADLTKKIIKGEPPQLNMGALDQAYTTGAALPDAEGFYKMGQLEREFINRYGPDEGRRQYVAKFSTPMAATTAGVTPTQNLMLAMYGNFMREAGKPLPAVKGEAYNIPYPIGGGKYGPTGNLQQYQKAAEAGGFDYTVNPKRYDFDWAFRGRRDAPVIDEQMMKGMTGEPQGAEAAKGGYGYYSKPVSERAGAFNVDPIQYQEVGWAGLKNQSDIAAAIKRGATPERAAEQAFQGQPMIQDVNDQIERTSRLLQIPPAEVVRRGLVESKLPTYALPFGFLGAGAMGSLAAPDRYDEGAL